VEALQVKTAVLTSGERATVSVKVEGVGAFNICMLRADRAPTATFTILPLTGKAEFRVTGGSVALTGNLEPREFLAPPGGDPAAAQERIVQMAEKRLAEQAAKSPVKKAASPAVVPQVTLPLPKSPLAGATKSPLLGAAKSPLAQAAKSPAQKPAGDSIVAQFTAVVKSPVKRPAEPAPAPAKKAKTEAKPEPKKPEPKKPEPKKPEAPKPEPKKEEGTVLGKRRMPSGLVYEIVKAGKGPIAQPGKKATVRYCGRLVKTGRQFDKGSIPFRVGRGEVIKGWDEGVKGMLTGEKRKLFIPAHLGYGREGAPPDIPRNADLHFDVELLKVG